MDGGNPTDKINDKPAGIPEFILARVVLILNSPHRTESGQISRKKPKATSPVYPGKLESLIKMINVTNRL